jgi:hypothetical protein
MACFRFLHNEQTQHAEEGGEKRESGRERDLATALKCPLYPRKRTFAVQLAMSAKCQ